MASWECGGIWINVNLGLIKIIPTGGNRSFEMILNKFCKQKYFGDT